MALFAAGAAFFLWRAIRSGAMTADEAPKYRMMVDDDPIAAGQGPPRGAWGAEGPPDQERQTTPSASRVLLPDRVPLRERAELLRRQ